MESASCSIFKLHSFSSSLNKGNKSYYETPPRIPTGSLHLGLSFTSVSPINYSCAGIRLHPIGCSTSTSSSQNPSQELAVLLEVDGVLIDAHRLGNLQAFNAAFKKLGLDCANWTKPIYVDLVRKSAGDEQMMLVLFFNHIGWPSSLPTTERGTFVERCLKEKKSALDEIAMSKSSPLRPGVEDFIDDALNEGVPVGIIIAYGKSDENIARSIIEKLGEDRISKIKIVGNEDVEQSLYGQLGNLMLPGEGEHLAKDAREAVSAQKLMIAEEVASVLKLGVAIDTTSSESLGKTVAALRAGAEYTAVPVENCVLIAGSQSGVTAAELIGMPCVVLRSSLTSRTQFQSAKAVLDGFGGPDLTIAKLRHKR